MRYVRTINNQYPIDEQGIRGALYPLSLPDILSSELLASHGFARVLESPKPACKPYQSVSEAPPKKVSGVWRQQWEINTPPLADCKLTILGLINRKCDQLLSQIKAGYPQGEVESWAKQEAEAKAYLADNGAPVPLITAISASRGWPVEQLANAIMLKSNAYASVVGSIIGTRQALESALDEADESTIDLIAWPE